MKKNPVLSHVVGVLLACLACLHASAREASGQLAVSAWPTFQHDLRHTGQSTFNGPASVTLKWTYQGYAPLKSAPAIGTTRAAPEKSSIPCGLASAPKAGSGRRV